MKHIELDCHFIRDKGIVSLEHIRSEVQAADIMTMALL